MNVNAALVRRLPLNPTLLVVKAPYGPDRYQRLLPQSMTPLGYWPFSRWLGLDWSSKLTVVCDAGVAVGVAAPLVAMTKLSKLVSQPLVLPTVTVVHGLPQPVAMVIS